MNKHRLELESMRLQHFATFQDQQISFENGFNSIVGETGSGKSLILDALIFLFGQKANKGVIRNGSDFCVIEASFHYQGEALPTFFEKNGLFIEEGQFTIRRIFQNKGPSKAFINLQQVPLHLLQLFATTFVDVIGQFENQKLLDPKYQLSTLDIFGGHQKEVQTYQAHFKELQKTRQQLVELEKRLSNQEKERDYLQFQLAQFDELSPEVSDYQEQLERKKELEVGEQNAWRMEKIVSLLDDTEIGIIPKLQQANQIFREITSFQDHTEQIESTIAILQDCSYDAQKSSFSEQDQESLEQCRQRLASYQLLKRKYQCSDTQELVQRHEEIKTQLDDQGNLEQRRQHLQHQQELIEAQVQKASLQLSKKRRAAAARMSKMITEQIQLLNMQGALVDLKLHKKSPGPSGEDELEFLIETNPGEGFFPVQKIASGGELSRLLLALRQIVSDKDSIDIFLFDEIDAGLGGQTANAIGRALKRVSEHSQVITITHLPQIAQFSNRLIVIKKTTTGGRTVSTATEVSHQGAKNRLLKEMVPLESL